MTFEELINEAIGMLQRMKRVSYRSMQRQFDLDDDNLDDLKEALLYTHGEDVNDEGQGLAWTGEPPIPLIDAQPETDGETRYLRYTGDIPIRLAEARQSAPFVRKIVPCRCQPLSAWLLCQSSTPASYALLFPRYLILDSGLYSRV